MKIIIGEKKKREHAEIKEKHPSANGVEIQAKWLKDTKICNFI